MGISFKITENKISVASPYHPDLPRAARRMGGSWNGSTWQFDPRDEQRVRKLYIEIYGTDGEAATEDLVTLEVSYDGSGHDRRKFPTGYSSKDVVEKSIERMKEYEIPFRISYTVHKDNYENLLYDMVWICERIKPSAIKLSIACQELTDAGVDYEKFKQDFLPYAEHLYMSYEIPICDLACSSCQMCDKSNFVGNSYYSPKSEKVMFQEAKTEKLFDGF